MPTRDERYQRMQSMGGNTWVDAKRRRLKWREMNVPHLRNAANFLENRILKLESEIESCLLYSGNGEGAQHAAEAAADAATHEKDRLETVQQRLRLYAELREEFYMIGEGP